MPTYHNPWIPAAAWKRLSEETGTILDVGGGAAPYYRAAHILDVQPFDADRLSLNAWGAPEPATSVAWTREQYTQWDVCDGRRWPFDDNTFDLGLCSHCLEDLRDPLPAVRELSRVCRRVLIITPSRLIEQTRGIDHPLWYGFAHHPWMVYETEGKLVFQRKSFSMRLRDCHVVCPSGWTLPTEEGSSWFYGDAFEALEKSFPDVVDEVQDYRMFVASYRKRRDLFIRDPRARSWRYWVFRFRRRWLGVV